MPTEEEIEQMPFEGCARVLEEDGGTRTSVLD